MGANKLSHKNRAAVPLKPKPLPALLWANWAGSKYDYAQSLEIDGQGMLQGPSRPVNKNAQDSMPNTKTTARVLATILHLYLGSTSMLNADGRCHLVEVRIRH